MLEACGKLVLLVTLAKQVLCCGELSGGAAVLTAPQVSLELAKIWGEGGTLVS